jgi:hypothetical protein
MEQQHHQGIQPGALVDFNRAVGVSNYMAEAIYRKRSGSKPCWLSTRHRRPSGCASRLPQHMIGRNAVTFRAASTEGAPMYNAPSIDIATMPIADKVHRYANAKYYKALLDALQAQQMRLGVILHCHLVMLHIRRTSMSISPLTWYWP